ncbi:uncharacterized protein LOC133316432 [Gastrolobium bilobum]|uniref:uncharacterized protein LOC133316432 n=1 Tax=Gastrolobium bilobum TaxID=150636 RepID=UPI002AB19A1E|nr:uncharacterized protein LOC133316432 [Gastrolobium bilobum]
MFPTMFACLNSKISDEKIVEQLKVTKAVYRDELTKKKSPPPSKAVKKKSVRFADSESTVMGEEDNEKNLVKGRCTGNELGERTGIRVKVKMTKKEAARLLSKCKEGGILEFKDVARELVELPQNRVSIMSTCTK